MPWSGGTFTRTNGVHTGSTLWVQDRDAGTKILATRHDTHDQDLADGINETLEKSGSNAATGDLDIGSNRITLVADGTAKTDAATVNQIQSNASAFQATDTGTANAYVIALSPAITAYAAGQRVSFKAANASTTAATLTVNTLGTMAIKKKNDQDIASGYIESGSIVTVVYDGTSFQMTSQLASASTTSPGGSDTQVQYNSSDAFAGSANLVFSGTVLTLPTINLGDENLSTYDEGTWTPVLQGQTTPGSPTYSTQVGRYVRIGNMVHVSAAIVYSDKGTIGGNMRIESLPFTASNVSGMRQAFSIAKYNLINLNVGGGFYQITLQLVDNQTYGYLTECGDNIASALITDADIADTTAIWYTGSYNIV